MFSKLYVLLLATVVASCASESPGSISGTIRGTKYPVATSLSATISYAQGFGRAFIALSSSSELCQPADAQIAHPGEKTLNIVLTDVGMTADAERPPMEPGAYTVVSGTPGPGTKAATVYSSVLDATCGNNADDQAQGVSGTVTLTRIDGNVYDGRFDVMVDSGDHITGTFSPTACTSFETILTGSGAPPPTCVP